VTHQIEYAVSLVVFFLFGNIVGEATYWFIKSRRGGK
jgi:hypothetical protein